VAPVLRRWDTSDVPVPRAGDPHCASRRWNGRDQCELSGSDLA